jgi:hypothetical protein
MPISRPATHVAALTLGVILLASAALSQTIAPFKFVRVDSTHLSDPWGKSVGDVNGDGKIDLLAGGNSSGGLIWYENPGWAPHVISNSTGFSTDIEVGDIDNDGLNDVVALGEDSNGAAGIIWFKNTGFGGTWTGTTVDKRTLHDIELADLDGDGDIDIVARDQEVFGTNHGDIIYVYLQTNPTTWVKSQFACTNGEGLLLYDLSGDGKKDVIINGTWFENNGSGTGWTAHVYSTSYTQRSVSVAVGDINGDGRPDITLSPSEPVGDSYHISWFESPVDPKTAGWTEHIVVDPVETDHHALGVADINGDGAADIVTAAMSSGSAPQEVAVYYNGDGKGTSWKKGVLSNDGSHNIRLLDVDGDGDIDVFGSNWQGSDIDLWVNKTKSPAVRALDSWVRHEVDPDMPWIGLRLAGIDMDGDSLKDIVVAGWWYKNPGKPGGNWVRHPFGDSLYNLVVIYDFDGDGHPDVLCTKGDQVNVVDSHEFAWGRNDGKGNFTIYNNIQTASAGDFLQGAAVGKFIPGGPVQVAISWHDGGNGITMITMPANPKTGTWTTTDISATTQKEALSKGDIDRDNRDDLLLGTKWLRNTSGGWTTQTLFSTSGLPHRNLLVDMNNDGRLDAVVGYQAISVTGKLAWYQQPATATNAWAEHVIANIVGPMSLSVSDMNNDGLLDVVAGEHNLDAPETAKLHIFENLGNALTWTDHVIATGDEHHDGAITVDIDNDGDLDILSMKWGSTQLLLFENQAVVLGVDDRTQGTAPSGYRLNPAYPNPFNPATVVSCQLPVVSDVQLVVYDLLGREVQVLAEGRMGAGEHRFEFRAGNLSSGVYLCRMSARAADGEAIASSQTVKLLLLK